jgi:hypothetical protein
MLTIQLKPLLVREKRSRPVLEASLAAEMQLKKILSQIITHSTAKILALTNLTHKK